MAEPTKPPPTFFDPPPFPVAEAWRRVVGYVVDVALVAMLVQALHWSALALLFGGQRPAFTERPFMLSLVVLATVSLPTWIWFAAFESCRWQATPGKLLLRTRVVGLDGRPIGFGRALARTVVKLLPWEVLHHAILLPVPLFDLPDDEAASRLKSPALMASVLLFGSWIATLLLTPRTQGVHDVLADTLVVPRGDATPRRDSLSSPEASG